MLPYTEVGWRTKAERFGASGTQVVRLGNLYQGRLDLGRSPVFIAEPTPEDGAFAAKAGDILVSQTGTRYKRDYGNCVLLNSDDQEVFVNQRILCLSPTESVLPKFWPTTETLRLPELFLQPRDRWCQSGKCWRWRRHGCTLPASVSRRAARDRTPR